MGDRGEVDAPQPDRSGGRVLVRLEEEPLVRRGAGQLVDAQLPDSPPGLHDVRMVPTPIRRLAVPVVGVVEVDADDPGRLDLHGGAGTGRVDALAEVCPVDEQSFEVHDPAGLGVLAVPDDQGATLSGGGVRPLVVDPDVPPDPDNVAAPAQHHRFVEHARRADDVVPVVLEADGPGPGDRPRLRVLQLRRCPCQAGVERAGWARGDVRLLGGRGVRAALRRLLDRPAGDEDEQQHGDERHADEGETLPAGHRAPPVSAS